MFVRSIDRAEWEAIGMELEDDDRVNGLTEDWLKVGRVCQRLDDERAEKAKRKGRDGVPSQREEAERQRESARVGVGARIAEAYAALEAMLEEEERRRPQAETEKTDLPHATAEDRYHGTTGEGAEQNALSTCGDRTAKDEAEIQIAEPERWDQRFRACQPEIPVIGEASPDGACAIGKKTTADHEESVATDKGVKRTGDSLCLPTLAPETMAVGPECPRESQAEEGGGERPRITGETIRGRSGRKPTDPIPENSAFGPVCPCKTEEMDGGTEESWHDASEEGWETACEEAEDRRGTRRSAFRFVWSRIRSWIVRSRPDSA